MQRFDLANTRDGIGIDAEWCSDCGLLFRWHTQISNKRMVELND